MWSASRAKVLCALCVLGLWACNKAHPQDPPAHTASPSSTGAPQGAPPDLGARLRADVEYLASDALKGRDEGSEGGLAAQAYITQRLKACGIRPLGADYAQPIDGLPGAANILGVIPGADPTLQNRYLILSAHHDHIGPCDGDRICNGADDNAAGVALVLAVGCEMASKATQPRRSVLIATWDAEEPPTFLSTRMGSRFFVEHPPLPHEAIDLALVLDLVGSDLWPGFQGHLLMGAEHSAFLSDLIDKTPFEAPVTVRRAGLHLIEETPLGHQAWSDYDPFRNAHIPYLLLSNGQNKRYHTPNDRPEHINYPKLTAEARFLSAFVQSLADHPTPGPNPFGFDPDRQDLAHDAHVVLELLNLALANTSGLVDTLALGPVIRLRLAADRAAVEPIAARPTSEPLSSTDTQTLRTAIQRIMCLCGPYAAPPTCLLF